MAPELDPADGSPHLAGADKAVAVETAVVDASWPYRLGTYSLAQWGLFGIPSTSLWTGAAIIVRSSLTKNCTVTRPRASSRPTPFSLAG